MSTTHFLVALYDATSELELYSSGSMPNSARMLGTELASAGFGAIGRIGSPVVQSMLVTISAARGTAIALSPASSAIEHEKGFRLPQVSAPTVYTGRGALGADVAALASSQAVVIFGSEDEALTGVIGCMSDTMLPIAILSEESPQIVSARISERYPGISAHVRVFGDPRMLVQDLALRLKTHMRSLKEE